MRVMFQGCKEIQYLDLSNFNTKNVDNMSCMFSGCLSLKELNFSNFNTKMGTDMKGMFFGCSNDLQKKIIYENKNIKDNAFKYFK